MSITDSESELDRRDQASPNPLRRCLPSAASSVSSSAGASLLRLQLVCDDEVRRVSLTRQPRRRAEILTLFAEAFPCRLRCRRVDLSACRIFVLDKGRGAYLEVADAADVSHNAVLLLVTPPAELMTSSSCSTVPICNDARMDNMASNQGVPHQIGQQFYQQQQQAGNRSRESSQVPQQELQRPRQQYELVCTCPAEVKQALHDAGYFWESGNSTATESSATHALPCAVSGQPSQHMELPPSIPGARSSTLDSLSLDEGRQQQPNRHRPHQHQQLHHVRQNRPHQPAAQYAPSSSSLDSAFSGQSTNSDGSLSSSRPAVTNVPVTGALTRCTPQASVSADSLRHVRDQTAQLRRDFQSLRDSHRESVQAMNALFQEKMLNIQTILSGLCARVQKEAIHSNLANFEAAVQSEQRKSNGTHCTEAAAVPFCHHVGRFPPLPNSQQRKAASQSPITTRNRPSNQPQLMPPLQRQLTTNPTSSLDLQRRALLRSIRAIVPDHGARMRAVSAIDKSLATSPRPSANAAAGVKQQPQRRQQRAVVFSNTVKVDDGRELIGLNGCPDEPRRQHQAAALRDGERDDDVWKRQQPLETDAAVLPAGKKKTSLAKSSTQKPAAMVHHSASVHGFYSGRSV